MLLQEMKELILKEIITVWVNIGKQLDDAYWNVYSKNEKNFFGNIFLYYNS